jgi:hypothetical protein
MNRGASAPNWQCIKREKEIPMKNVRYALFCLALCAPACGGIDRTDGIATNESQSKTQIALDESGRNTQPAYRSPYVTVTRGPVGHDCVVVTRLSNFNKVYATIEQQRLSGGGFTTLVARTDLNKNEPLRVCAIGSYQMRVVVERRDSNDYSFTSH